MRKTKKYLLALEILKISPNQTKYSHQQIYDKLFAQNYNWDGKKWVRSQLKSKKALPISVRLSGDELSCRAVCSLIGETLNVTDISIRQNVDGLTVRIYFTVNPV